MEFVCANTDAQALNRSAASALIQLAAPASAPAPGGPAARAAEEAVDRIRESISGANMLFITAGMGGGTGTGAAPVIARRQRDGHPDRRRGHQSRSTSKARAA